MGHIPHSSIIHSSLVLPRIQPSIHGQLLWTFIVPCYQVSSVQGSKGGWPSKCKNCQLADQFPTSPSGGPSIATAHKSTTTIKVSKDQCRGSSSYNSILQEEQIWGDCLIALKLVVLVKDVIYDVYEYTEDIPLIN